MTVFILSYLFQFLGLGFVLTAGINKNKKWILFLTFCANICSTIVMILAGRYDGAATTVIGTIRAFLFLFHDRAKDNKIFWGCTIAHAVVGILSWQSSLSLLIIAAPLVLCWTNWFGNVKQIKYGTIFSDLCWAVFDLANGIYVEAARDIGEILSNIVGLLRTPKMKNAMKPLRDEGMN